MATSPMEFTPEFASLVSTYRRLLLRYGQHNVPPSPRSPPKPANAADASHQSHEQRPNGTPWIEPVFAAPSRYPFFPATQALEPRCCPRCHFAIEAKPPEGLSVQCSPRAEPDGTRRAFHAMQDNGMNVNHMLQLQQLQLASMEYARLLSVLGTGNGMLPGYHADPSQHQSQRQPPKPVLTHIDLALNLQGKKRKSGSELEEPVVKKTIPVKRTRLVWTKELHEKFVEAVEKLGIQRAVPKAILEVMAVEGLTRENVASHLQKYRLQLAQQQAKDGHQEATEPENEKLSTTHSATTYRSQDLTESDSTASVTLNTIESSATVIPDSN